MWEPFFEPENLVDMLFEVIGSFIKTFNWDICDSFLNIAAQK